MWHGLDAYFVGHRLSAVDVCVDVGGRGGMGGVGGGGGDRDGGGLGGGGGVDGNGGCSRSDTDTERLPVLNVVAPLSR